jgi:hypothetical protein
MLESKMQHLVAELSRIDTMRLRRCNIGMVFEAIGPGRSENLLCVSMLTAKQVLPTSKLSQVVLTAFKLRNQVRNRRA